MLVGGDDSLEWWLIVGRYRYLECVNKTPKRQWPSTSLGVWLSGCYPRTCPFPHSSSISLPTKVSFPLAYKVLPKTKKKSTRNEIQTFELPFIFHGVSSRTLFKKIKIT
jgi:hypothetical protein